MAPGGNIQLMGKNGQKVIISGTSFSAPYIAGIFAVACSAYPHVTTGTVADLTVNHLCRE
jgi:subtilase family serine protease